MANKTNERRKIHLQKVDEFLHVGLVAGRAEHVLLVRPLLVEFQDQHQQRARYVRLADLVERHSKLDPKTTQRKKNRSFTISLTVLTPPTNGNAPRPSYKVDAATKDDDQWERSAAVLQGGRRDARRRPIPLGTRPT